MRVKFKDPYFAPGYNYKRKSGDIIGGKLYDKGIHDVPDGMPVPASASVITKTSDVPEEVDVVGQEGPVTFRDFDDARAAADNEDSAFAAAEKHRVGGPMGPVKRSPGRPKKYE